MKKQLVLGLLAAISLGLVGCATDKTSSNPGNDDPIIMPPIFGDPENPDEDPGREYVITEDGTILVDSEEWGKVDSDGFVTIKDEDGNDKIVGTIYKHSDTAGEYWVFSPVEGGAYYFVRDSNGKVIINWERSIIDGGWGVSTVPPEAVAMKMSPEAKAALKTRAQAAKAARQGIQINN